MRTLVDIFSIANEQSSLKNHNQGVDGFKCTKTKNNQNIWGTQTWSQDCDKSGRGI